MIKTKSLLENEYTNYLKILKDLVAINTVYTNEKGIKKALNYCKNYFKTNLHTYISYFDKNNNLICIHKTIDVKKPIVYLSAHIDTVPANKNEWDKRFNPFKPFENKETIVGRGVSDDKAGVAYELFLGSIIKNYFPNTTNIAFTISSREEQSGTSSKEIGEQLGIALPIGKKAYLMTLENNVRIAKPPILSINYAEHTAIGIEIKETLEKIRFFFKNDSNLWNPTVISPLSNKKYQFEVLEQTGGHAATTPREKNKIYQLLLNKKYETYVIKSGDKQSISSISSTINYAKTKTINKHLVIFDLRTTKEFDTVIKELEKHTIDYKIVKKLDTGYDVQKRLMRDKIYTVFNNSTSSRLAIMYDKNPGTTDSGRIYASCSKEVKNKLLPLTLGPGSRSQRDTIPPRMSHGPNETFVKSAGLEVIVFITQVLIEMKLLQQDY